MDKLRPTYALEDIKQSFTTVEKLRVTRTALRNVQALGLQDSDIVEIIRSLKGSDFDKSMTTYIDHRLWQDVYHAKYRGLTLYVKFMKDTQGYLIVSLKEK